MQTSLPRDSLPDARRVGRFMVLSQRPRRDAGDLYTAYDPTLDRRVAIVVMPPTQSEDGSPSDDSTALTKARTLASLSHPNVVAVHDAGHHEGRVFVAMEDIEDPTLAQWAATHPPTTAQHRRATIDILVQAAEGLAAAHRAGVEHGNVRARSIRVGEDGAARLVDFLLVPPEPHSDSCESKQRAYGDAFQLCMTGFQTCFGPPPQDPRSPDHDRRGYPVELRDALLRGMDPDPTKRFESLGDLADALRQCVPPPPRPSTRRATAVATIGAAIGISAALWWGSRSSAATSPCHDGLERVAEYWNDESRQRIAAGFSRTGLSYAAASAATVAADIDNYALHWAQAHDDNCAATVEAGSQAEQTRAYRAVCLEYARHRVGALIDRLAQADAAAVDHGPRSVAQLSSPQSCLPRARGATAAQDAEGERVESIYRELATIDASTLIVVDEDATRRVEALAEGARSRGDHRMEARAELLLARTDPTRISTSFSAAVISGDEPLAIAVAIAGAAHELDASPTKGQRQKVKEWVRYAQSLASRHPSSADLAARIAYQAGRSALERGEVDEAITLFRSSIDGARDLSWRRLWISRARLGLARALRANGDLATATQEGNDALDALSAALGRSHPEVLRSTQQLMAPLELPEKPQ